MAELSIAWLTRLAYLVPIVYLVGISYPGVITSLFGSPWTLEWWQIYTMGLFCTAYYFTMWAFDRIEKMHAERKTMTEEEREKENNFGPGIFHAILMMPLASIVTGVLLYAPGAAW